jgi:hypothetical protein
MFKKNMFIASFLVLSLAIAILSTISVTGEQIITYASVSDQYLENPSEYSTVEKVVGQYVHIKAKVKNTGDIEACYLIVAKWREDGSMEWEKAGIADVKLCPGTDSDVLLVGKILCEESMMGKCFDVKFVVYTLNKEFVLDEEEIDKAWCVTEGEINGTLTDFWVE